MKALILTLTIASLIVFFSVFSKADIKEDLILYLPFDEGKGDKVEDKSGNKFVGTLNNGPKWVEGK